MKGFQFRLERLLRLRAQAEQARARELMSAGQTEEERRLAVNRANGQLDTLSLQMQESTGKVASAGILINLGLTVHAATTAIAHAEKSHAEATTALEVEQGKFLEARKERRIVERLRELRHAAWHTETGRAEQRDMDEIALQRHSTGGQT
ncbi:MAG: flagellar export protein FliJ [Gemmatimonadota bacterium]